MYLHRILVHIAQTEEQGTSKPKVGGSNPSMDVRVLQQLKKPSLLKIRSEIAKMKISVRVLGIKILSDEDIVVKETTKRIPF